MRIQDWLWNIFPSRETQPQPTTNNYQIHSLAVSRPLQTISLLMLFSYGLEISTLIWILLSIFIHREITGNENENPINVFVMWLSDVLCLVIKLLIF